MSSVYHPSVTPLWCRTAVERQKLSCANPFPRSAKRSPKGRAGQPVSFSGNLGSKVLMSAVPGSLGSKVLGHTAGGRLREECVISRLLFYSPTGVFYLR